MSHAIYQTRALILKTKNIRESNKLIYLYTEQFGLIHASIQSVREVRSKLRYHLHQYSLVELDLVLGRSIWRVTGIHELNSSFHFAKSHWYGLVSMLSNTLIRLCTGEEKSEELWKEITLFFQQIKEDKHDFIQEHEIILMVRILYALGYWEQDDFVIKTDNPYSRSVFDLVTSHKTYYIKKINESLKSSQL